LGASSHRLSLRYRVSINLSLPLSTACDAKQGNGVTNRRIIRLTADDVDGAREAREGCQNYVHSDVHSGCGSVVLVDEAAEAIAAVDIAAGR
jgi:hypothetical protein